MHVVVVGAGLAGARAVEELRAAGHGGDVTLVGAEPHRPYDRPPLSKDVLLGRAGTDAAYLFGEDWYAAHGVDLRVASPAVRLDLGCRAVALARGEELRYDRLLLATGSAPRRLPDLERLRVPVTYLRTVDDAEQVRRLLTGGTGRVLVVGAGWIGLEVTAAARENGVDVTVVEPAELPLVRVLGPEMARLFADLHREHGVDLRLGTSLLSVADAPGGASARLSDGTSVLVDALVVAVGVRPRTELAEAAGLATGDGVLVDAALRTSDPSVWAAGDIANHEHPVLGRRVRAEHWEAAQEQGRHAARALLGDDAPYTRLPYFYTDQYDLCMEYVGRAARDGYDAVVVDGDVPGRVMRVRYVEDGIVVAVMQINDAEAMDGLREAVGKPL